MAARIIERLSRVPCNPYPPYLCIAVGLLAGIAEEIKSLKYEDFISVLRYVRNSALPTGFKKYLEIEYN
ncbi:MAG TPA: hypothetical protein VJ343_02505, partial [archaeon]|nr:hypothetical protein [archaeon]